MTPFRTIRLVATRDFVERVQSRAFQISSGFTLVLVLAAALAPSLFGDDEPPPVEIGVVGEAHPALATSVSLALDEEREVQLEPFATLADGEAALDEGEIDVVIVAGTEVVARDSDSSLGAIVAAVAGALEIGDRAAALGLTAADVASLLSFYDVRGLEEESDEQTANRAFAFFGSILLFISIVTYGQWILIGVIEEKTNRVVEVVLGAVRAHHLLAGKVLGIGILGFAQLIVTAAIGLAVVTWAGAFELPTATVSVVANVVLWFGLGFAFYATAFAAAGSLVSRQEDAQNVAFPLTLALTLAYAVAAFSITGDNVAVRVASLLPPFAPMTMPLRIAGGDATVWEVVVSIALMVAAVYLLIRVAGRVYRGALLRSGTRVKLREAWRSAEG